MSEVREKPKRTRKKPIQQEQEASVGMQNNENIKTKSFLQVLREYDEAYKVRLETTEPTPLTLAIARLETKLEQDPNLEQEYSKHIAYWTQVWCSSLDIQSRINTIVYHIVDITK